MCQKFKYKVLMPIFLVFSCNAFAQYSNNSLYFWKLHSISGEAIINGHYREQERIGMGIYEYQKSSYLSGGMFLKSTSSILHQNFLTLDIDAGYMPETSRDNYIFIPDQAEVRTMKKLGGISASFFKDRTITLNVFGNYEERYFARENLTDVKATDQYLGGTINYSNKFLPLTLNFKSKKWNEKEVHSERKITLDQKLFDARLNKSFTKIDKNEFRYSHDENANVNLYSYLIANTIDNIDFVSHIVPDTKQKYSFNTMLSNYNQHGNLNLKRFQATEAINIQLPANFAFFGNYNFYNVHQPLSGFTQNSVNIGLNHKLFSSLQSRLNYDFNKINHTAYKESNWKPGFDLNYTKKIPKGQLLVSYRFDRYHQDYYSEPVLLHIINEQYALSDNAIVLLRLADIALQSVVVKDANGALIYENGLDYILLERGKYIEIRRIPGGSIANGATVLVDYTATQQGAYKYDANTHVFSSIVYLFKNVLSFNYRFSTQDYSNIEKTEFVTLNFFTQNLVGCRIDFDFVTAGAEYDNYKSSILPYRMMRYYLNFKKGYGKNLMLMLNCNLQEYVMLDEPEPKYQEYMDITGKANYSLLKQTQLNLDLMYRKQKGRGIDLDLLSSKLEITSAMNRLYLTFGLEVYRRNYVGETINFKGTYIKIIRKF